MSGFLPYAVIVLSMIVFIGFFNEKVTHLTYEIALMLFSLVIGTVITLAAAAGKDIPVLTLLSDVKVFDLEEFLINGVLCFMLFAGACHIRLPDFRRLMRPVTVLAFICTLLGALFYGLLFFGVSTLMGLGFSLPVCLMFGSIVALTDPIAATSILNKFGLPKDVSFLIEGESLLNDGLGVALFVCFSGIVAGKAGGGFVAIMLREILGAVVIGVSVTLLFFILFRKTEDDKRRIYISLLNVALAYWLCEIFDCSGAIASVICGALFFALRGREEEQNRPMNLKEFDDFWEVLDTTLNSVLYVILGFTFIRILQMEHVVILSCFAVVCNLIARYGSVYLSTCLTGPLPDGFTRSRFSKLLTWGGLRGGLSIALAMSTLPLLPDDTYRVILGCTYAIVFFTTVVQGLSMKQVYEKIIK